MAYCAYITTLKNVRKHPNADRLQLGECFGNTVCVNLDYTENQIGIYFPVDGQLSVEFAEHNNLLRKKDENGVNIGGYMDPDKRNVTAIKLRGEKSDGLFLPMSCLDYCYPDVEGGAAMMLNVGDTVDVVNGHNICTKYIPRTNPSRIRGSEGNKTRKKKVPVAPLFSEHADTEQLAYNLEAFKSGDLVEITLKMHGTSQRTGYLPRFIGYKNDFWGRVMNIIDPNRKMGKFASALYEKASRYATPIYDWGYVSGTRRTVLENYDGGYYGSDKFREPHSKFFEGKLHKGESVYYEVVGFTSSGAPIMSDADNKKTQDKEFIKQYGDTTVFSYGCTPDITYELEYDAEGEVKDYHRVPNLQSDIYVYRMTMTNEDGDIVEYTPDFMRYRCEQMGVKTVPVFWSGFIPMSTGDPAAIQLNQGAGDWIKEMAEKFYDGPDPIGKTHVREGVVVRIINRPKFAAYKHKNWYFKCIEGIVKADADTPDMEEAQDIVEEV